MAAGRKAAEADDEPDSKHPNPTTVPLCLQDQDSNMEVRLEGDTDISLLSSPSSFLSLYRSDGDERNQCLEESCSIPAMPVMGHYAVTENLRLGKEEPHNEPVLKPSSIFLAGKEQSFRSCSSTATASTTMTESQLKVMLQMRTELDQVKASNAASKDCIDELRAQLADAMKENEDFLKDVSHLINTCERLQKEKMDLKNKVREKRTIIDQQREQHERERASWNCERQYLKEKLAACESRVHRVESILNINDVNFSDPNYHRRNRHGDPSSSLFSSTSDKEIGTQSVRAKMGNDTQRKGDSSKQIEPTPGSRRRLMFRSRSIDETGKQTAHDASSNRPSVKSQNYCDDAEEARHAKSIVCSYENNCAQNQRPPSGSVSREYETVGKNCEERGKEINNVSSLESRPDSSRDVAKLVTPSETKNAELQKILERYRHRETPSSVMKAAEDLVDQISLLMAGDEDSTMEDGRATG